MFYYSLYSINNFNEEMNIVLSNEWVNYLDEKVNNLEGAKEGKQNLQENSHGWTGCSKWLGKGENRRKHVKSKMDSLRWSWKLEKPTQSRLPLTLNVKLTLEDILQYIKYNEYEEKCICNKMKAENCSQRFVSFESIVKPVTSN